jgi:hypothetical protein
MFLIRKNNIDFEMFNPVAYLESIVYQSRQKKSRGILSAMKEPDVQVLMCSISKTSNFDSDLNEPAKA